jgi:hypothetical protein
MIKKNIVVKARLASGLIQGFDQLDWKKKRKKKETGLIYNTG